MPETAPWNREAEEQVLGAILVSPRAASVALELLSPDDFYLESHGTIFAAAAFLHRAGDAVDVVTVGDHLAHLDLGPKVHELARLSLATANARHWAEIVRRDARLRQRLNAHLRAVEAIYAGKDEDAQRAEEQLLQADVPDAQLVPWFDAANLYLEERKEPPEAGAVMTPWAFLDLFRNGRLYVLSGYTGDGKTVAAIEFLKAAAGAGVSVGFISLEMSRKDIVDRIVTSFGDERVALREIARWKGAIIGDPSAGAGEIERFQRVGGFDFLIVDHLHRMDWGERRDMERNVRAVTNLAIRHNIPVLLLAQLRRNVGSMPYPRPNMTMLRETAIIEQEASMVAFIYRKRDTLDQRTNEAEFIVDKNRYGDTNSWPLWFDSNRVAFTETWIPYPLRGAA